MSYCTTQEVWDNLGKDAYTKVRDEIVGTSSAITPTDYELSHDNVISNSLTLYEDGSIIDPSSYSLNLDDGKIIGLSVAIGKVITADYDYADLPDSMIQKMISSSDSLINTETGRTFGKTTCVEYLSVEENQSIFWLKNYPVITISEVSINMVDAVNSPVWSTCAEGLGGDFLANDEDKLVGRIRFINNFPNVGYDQLKVTYEYGYTTTPPLVNELSILLTLRQMANSSVYKSIFKGYDNFTPVKLTEIENRIEELKRILKKQSINLI